LERTTWGEADNFILNRAIAAINTLGATKLGVQGFCWGGKFSVLMGASDKFMAVAANHPSGITYNIPILNYLVNP
jgi:dienelactone hydrolase